MNNKYVSKQWHLNEWFIFKRKTYFSLARVGVIGSAVACATMYVAVTEKTWFQSIRRNAVRSVITGLAFFAINTGCVFLHKNDFNKLLLHQ